MFTRVCGWDCHQNGLNEKSRWDNNPFFRLNLYEIEVQGNVTFFDHTGFLLNCKYLIHDRDTKFCKSFRSIIASMGIKPIRLPVIPQNFIGIKTQNILAINYQENWDFWFSIWFEGCLELWDWSCISGFWRSNTTGDLSE